MLYVQPRCEKRVDRSFATSMVAVTGGGEGGVEGGGR